jgi:hypothetical protein
VLVAAAVEVGVAVAAAATEFLEVYEVELDCVVERAAAPANALGPVVSRATVAAVAVALVVVADAAVVQAAPTVAAALIAAVDQLCAIEVTDT